ncbi:hypothetical protein ACIQPS_32995 [Streptomyces sp. NPDC091290]|uniref:hypothetical protein n=1 Tax=Streptomyces sp. NPDC091290 TaxID=3365990 RepID=UPI0037F8CD48
MAGRDGKSLLDNERSRVQPSSSLPTDKDERMTSLKDPVMGLVRASLDPAAQTARKRTESPVCQVVIRAAEADLAAGGADNVNKLAVGAGGAAAAGLTAWLAQERDGDPAVIIAEFEKTAAVHGIPPAPLVPMLKTLLTGPTGMEHTADFMVQLFHDDEEVFYDLIVDLAHYIATCIGLLAAHDISSRDDTLDALDDMLETFFTN